MNKEAIYSNVLHFAKRIHKKCIDQISSLTPQRDNRQQMYCICLYCRILELTKDCINLVLSPNINIGLEILLRCMLETLVDLKILVESPDYWQNMHAQALKQQIKLGKAAPENPFLKSIAKALDFSNVLAEKESELNKLEKQGYKTFKFKERFEKAKMSHEYESFYNILSDAVHPNLMNLQNYIHKGKSGPEFHVFNPLGQNALLGGLSMMLDMLLVSSEMVHAMFKSGVSFKAERNLLENILRKNGVKPKDNSLRKNGVKPKDNS